MQTTGLQPVPPQSIVCRMEVRRGRVGTGVWAGVIGLALVAGCAATKPDQAPADARCVVSVEPTMKMVTFASPEGLAEGVTSLFFPETPSVQPGDLVSLDNRSGQGGPKLQVLERSAKSCSAVAHSAAGHHGGH